MKDNYIYNLKEDLQKSKDLLKSIDSIEYRTKKNGRPYAKTEDNVLTTYTCRIRFDRGFKWLDVHGAEITKMYLSHKVAVFDCRQSLDGLKKEISDYRKYLVKEIETKETELKKGL